MRPERKDISKMRKFDNLEGRQFGEITILYPIETPNHVEKTNRSQFYWAQCSCGKEYAVSARTLKRKKRSNPEEFGATACKECAHKLRIAKFHTPHGLSQTGIYRIWLSMKGRCSEKWATNSHGARGIEVCEEWNKEGEEGFLKFHEWSMANGYAEGLTLERLDVNGPYSSDNCAWVGAKEQNYNKRNSLKIEVNGEMVSLSQYYYSEPNRIVPYSVISNRHRAGWNLEEMFSIPYGGKRGGGSILPTKETKRNNLTTAQKKAKRLRKIWRDMVRRCKTDGMLDYRDRGIRVCPAWYEDFYVFRAWAISNGYKHHLTLERKDVNGNYCPENCCWITRQEQAFNKRNTCYVNYQGKLWSLPGLYYSLKSKLPYTTVYSRYNRGWDGERIFNTPYKGKKKG